MGERICRCQTKLETENKLTLLCMPSTRYYTHNADLTAHNSNFLKQPSPNHKALGFYPTSIFHQHLFGMCFAFCSVKTRKNAFISVC